MRETREYMELLRYKFYPEDTSEHRAQRQRALDWMLAAFADDLTIVAPPEVAVRIYSRYAYLNKVHNSPVFKGAKTVASIKVRGLARDILLKMCTKQPDSVPEVVGALKKLRGDWRITSFAESIIPELLPTLQTLVRHDDCSIRAEAIPVRFYSLARILLSSFIRNESKQFLSAYSAFGSRAAILLIRVVPIGNQLNLLRAMVRTNIKPRRSFRARTIASYHFPWC